MTFEPLLPAGALLVAFLAMVGGCLRQYGAWHPLLPLRAVACGLVALLLANPVERRQVASATRPPLALVVDHSGSMGGDDGGGGATRLQVAVAAAERLSEELGERYRVTPFALGETLVTGLPDPGKAEGDTHLDALGRLAGSVPRYAAVVFVSDGADWLGARPEDDLGAAGVPVHTLGVGSASSATNLHVRLESGSPIVAPGEELTLSCALEASADLDGRATEVVIEEIARSGEAREILRAPATLGQRPRIVATVAAGEEIGTRLWRARAMALPGEEVETDNEAYLSVQVADRSLRVLVVEGRPYWDTTMAVRSWRRDRQLEVTTWFSLGERAYRAGPDLGSRIDAALLARIDVLVLGLAVAGELDDASAVAVATWVREGGGLLLLAPESGGAPAGPLAEIAPATWSELTRTLPAELAEEGGDDERDVTVREPESLAPLAQVLRGTQESPMLVVRRSGKGRVLALNMEGLWRLAMSGAGATGEGAAPRFWRQLLRDAARPVEGRLRTDRLRHRAGDRATIWIGGVSEGAAHAEQIRYRTPNGEEATFWLEGGRIRRLLAIPGLHTFTLGSESMTLVVEPADQEITRRARDDGRLLRLAEATSGSHRDVAAAAELSERLGREQELEEARVETTPLVTRRAWFWNIAMVLGLEWLLRRRSFGLS